MPQAALCVQRRWEEEQALGACQKTGTAESPQQLNVLSEGGSAKRSRHRFQYPVGGSESERFLRGLVSWWRKGLGGEGNGTPEWTISELLVQGPFRWVFRQSSSGPACCSPLRFQFPFEQERGWRNGALRRRSARTLETFFSAAHSEPMTEFCPNGLCHAGQVIHIPLKMNQIISFK
jgi:hypothetical protein